MVCAAPLLACCQPAPDGTGGGSRGTPQTTSSDNNHAETPGATLREAPLGTEIDLEELERRKREMERPLPRGERKQRDK